MTQPTATATIMELDYRESNGITISLQWSRRSNRLSVVVEDSQRGESFTLHSLPANAIEFSTIPTRTHQPLLAA